MSEKAPEFPYQMEVTIWGNNYTNVLCSGTLEDAQELANKLCRVDLGWKKIVIREANNRNNILLTKNK